MSAGNPPGLGGFGGDVGESQECYESLGFALKRLSEIRDNVETDSLNIESYVKELAAMVIKITKSMGRMFEHEPLRFMSMYTASGGGKSGGGHEKYNKGIMEHRVIQNLKNVNGDKSLFRQWHQKFTTAIGQFKPVYEEMVHKMARELDLGKEVDGVLSALYTVYGDVLWEASADIWRVLVDKTEAEAYDKIKMIPSGEGLRAYGVVYRWFTDVSGLGLSEQARRLMHPDPPKKEEELSESVDAWQDKMRRLEAHGDEYKIAGDLQYQCTEDADDR